MDRAAVILELTRDESKRLFVYDDATGKPITPNTICHGHPTIGVGRALDVHGLSDAEVAYLLGNDIDECTAQVQKAIPWWAKLDPIRQRVLVEMAFNMGVNGLLEFKNTLEFVRLGNYPAAADGMLKSRWATQVGERATRLARMMSEGSL